MKIAIYSDIVLGGAFRSMEALTKEISKKHQITIIPPIELSQLIPSRLGLDLMCLISARLASKKLAQKIDNQKFDLVFVSHDRYQQVPWILRYLKTPTVFLCQEPTRSFFEQFLDISPHWPLMNRLYERINRLIRKKIEIDTAKYASTIVANSYFSVESIFKAYGVYPKTIYLGVDTNIFKPISIKKENQILVVGNDEPQKDLSLAIKAISLLPVKNRPKLVIAGPRNFDTNHISFLAKKLKVKLQIYKGLDSSEMSHLYNQSLITLATAHLEPLGLSIIESLSCGIPVIAVNEAGFRETIIHGKTGLLCDRDPKEISVALQKVLNSKSLAKSMGSLGRKEVIKNFTWEKVSERLEIVFKNTVKNNV